jgi:hypothetical protein
MARLDLGRVNRGILTGKKAPGHAGECRDDDDGDDDHDAIAAGFVLGSGIGGFVHAGDCSAGASGC